MTSKQNLSGLKREKANANYLKHLLEGMQDWLEVKELSGHKELPFSRAQLEYEIEVQMKKPEPSITKIAQKMKKLGFDKLNIKEFKGIFKPKV